MKLLNRNEFNNFLGVCNHVNFDEVMDFFEITLNSFIKYIYNQQKYMNSKIRHIYGKLTNEKNKIREIKKPIKPLGLYKK